MKVCPQCHIRYPSSAVYCFLDGRELNEVPDPYIGKTVAGRYVIIDLLGTGGMATVYRARHKLVDRPCAIKLLNPGLAAEPTVRERFRREAKSAQAIAHPNVIEIFDQGETEDGTPYIVMELLEGRTLASLLEHGAVPAKRAVPIMIQTARGIARAHDLGVVHRDLKPENIFICSRADGSDLVKLLDFGIARSRSDTRLTNAGELFGTPQYMAPERIIKGEAGPSVDLYALGVIFFEMLTGRLPFEATDAPTFLIQHMKETPPAPRTIDPTIHEKLEALVLQLLEKDPRMRPVDAHRIEQDVAALAPVLGARPPPDPEKEPGSARAPARSLPTVVVEQWQQRVTVFEQMLARAYAGTPPDEAARLLGNLNDRVRELGDVRAAGAREQRALEELDARGRDGRQRLGFAVDALGSDASKAKDDLRAAHLTLERSVKESAEAAAAYAGTQQELLAWEGRSARVEPYAQLAQAYRACAESVDAWLRARRTERESQAALEERERTVSDLEYQLASLRTALANHEQGFDRDRDAAHTRAVELNARAEVIEHDLVHLATRFCDPLRSRAELAPLFQQLESRTSAA